MTLYGPHKALVLFSGGLDSILAAKILEEQGVQVTCLHFVSPFFGKPEKISHWQETYGLRILPVDISEDFVRLLARRPTYGFGSVINPCVDCKILMLRQAAIHMRESGACCVATGEVLGQRPMSQRRDTLNIILRDSGLRGKLLRPLSALRLNPTEAELDGSVDRNRLLGISGRGRKDQFLLAERFGLKEIPAPAGGCRLTERENARGYWPVLRHAPAPRSADFHLAATGRQFWHEQESSPDLNGAYWLIIGRNQTDNDRLMSLAAEKDLLFRTRDFPGPVALGRCFGRDWPEDALHGAAAFMASYSGKAASHSAETGLPVAVRVHIGSLDGPCRVLEVKPSRVPEFAWRKYSWEETRTAIREETRTRE